MINDKGILIYNRRTKKLEEKIEHGTKIMNFLYYTLIGRVLLWLFIARPWFSKLKGFYENSKMSKKDIMPFIKKHNIDCDIEEIKKFDCFNEFFTRRKKHDFENTNTNILISPADSSLQIYSVTENLTVNIKHSKYNIKDLLGGNTTLANEYKNGICLVFRLSVDNYHRYHFIDNGTLIYQKHIKGILHTVRPLSKDFKVFTRNTREINILETENFGKVTMVEIGALLVGKIKNHKIEKFNKFDEKGYFEYGGSTIVLLMKNNIVIDKDIINFSQKGYETKVFAGEKIGYKKEK